MGLDLSTLKYYGVSNSKKVDLNKNEKANGGVISFNAFKEKAGELLNEHNKKTDLMLKEYDELHRNGKMNDYEYRMAKLETVADAIIYELGVNSLYDIKI